jgi:hypothetical protein
MTSHYTQPPYPWVDHIDCDSFGRLDLSGSCGYSGAVGCMLDRLADIHKERHTLALRLAELELSRQTAERALFAFCDAQIVS